MRGLAGDVEDQALVDLGLDVEGVHELVDPVVEIHPTRVVRRGPARNPIGHSGPVVAADRRSRRVAEVGPGVDVVAPRRSTAGTSTRRRSTSSRCTGSPCSSSRLGRDGPARARRGGRPRTATGGVRRAPMSTRAVGPPSAPAPTALRQPREGARRDPRHVDREHGDEVRRAAGTASQPGQQPGGRTAAPRVLDGPGHRPGRGHLLADHHDLDARHGRGQGALQQRHPVELDGRLVDAVHARGGAAGEHHGAERRAGRVASGARRVRAVHGAQSRAPRPRSGRGWQPGGMAAPGADALRVALVQVASAQDPVENRDRLAELEVPGADLVVLPEVYQRDLGAPDDDARPRRRDARRPVRRGAHRAGRRARRAPGSPG